MHVRRAVDGNIESHGWLVEHFLPALRLQAEYRLPPATRRHADPEDIVQEVWMIVLPKLPLLRARDGRMTPVLVKYLSTTLLHRVNKCLRSALRADRRREALGIAAGAESRDSDGAGQVAADLSGVVTKVARRERDAEIAAAIAALTPRDREVVVLRGIEQHSNLEVAALLGERAATVSRRFRRALARLRVALPESVFAELCDDEF